MVRTRRALLGAVAGTLALAGCLGDGDGGGGGTTADQTTTAPATTEMVTETTSPATTTAGGDATVAVRSHPDLGDVLVGPDGLTLYMFDQDERGAGASSCTGGCADAWPPLTVDGEAMAGAGVSATLSTFDRGDGSTQVAANGWPLYYYASDTDPGDATGQGVNDVWWVLAPDGSPVRPSGTTTGGGGGGGGGGSPY
ncbi:COG4315 family predicted lipoprotein [Haloarchaeobius baliensis]|uniref:COG4315 family predicted lipoprotein n=1 Tax=Haloarchaeobius baliensis TaxID=1670458 RepID=UPI003F881CC0